MFSYLHVVIFTVVVHLIDLLLSMATTIYNCLVSLRLPRSFVSAFGSSQTTCQFSIKFKSNKKTASLRRQKRRNVNHLIIHSKSTLASLHYSTAFCLIPCLLVGCCVIFVVVLIIPHLRSHILDVVVIIVGPRCILIVSTVVIITPSSSS
jgi:hypothetical protein